MIGRHFLTLVSAPVWALAHPLYTPLCTLRTVCNRNNYTHISPLLLVRRPFGKSRGCTLSAVLPGRKHAVVHASALLLGSLKYRLSACHSHPHPPPTACLVPARAWAVVGLHQTRSTTNLHGPPNPPKIPQCYRRPPARKSLLTQLAGSREQVFSLTRREQSRPPPPNPPNITRLHPQNTSTNPPPPPGPTTRRHTAMALEILVPVHLGILNSNRPSQRHQRVRLISSPHRCHQTLPSLYRTPVGCPRSARPRILQSASHPRAGTKIETRIPIVAANGTGQLIHTPGRPLRKLVEIHMIHGSRSITLQPLVETSKSGQMKTVCYRGFPAIDATSQRTM